MKWSISCQLCDCFCGFPTAFTPLPHFLHNLKGLEKCKGGKSEDPLKLSVSHVWAILGSLWKLFGKKWLCVSLAVPEASRICLDFDESSPRQIQDIYSGMPRGHTVGGDVVAVRVASCALPPPSLSYDFAPLFTGSCLFFAEKRRDRISNPIPAQFMNVTVTCWTALTSAEVKAH